MCQKFENDFLRDRRDLALACLSSEEEYATWSLRREQERNK
jgi:hypothetical protein